MLRNRDHRKPDCLRPRRCHHQCDRYAHLLARGRRSAFKSDEGRIFFGFIASIFSMSSYVLFLYALTHGPVGAASAIRETSVLFALGISVIILKEPVGLLRWVACGIAFMGTALLRLA